MDFAFPFRVLTMKLLGNILIYSAIFTTLVSAGVHLKPKSEPVIQTADVRITNDQIKLAQAHDGPVGVSSIAGISTRNGRVSSFSGVYSHPGMKSPLIMTSGDNTGTFRSAVKYGNEKSNTSTITKRFENKYATGTVNISPGSVSVTSIAKAGPVPALDSYRPMSLLPVKPIIPDPFIQQPFPMFEPRYYNPWLTNNFNNYKNTLPPNVDSLTPPWFHPQLYPFLNYWP